MSDRKKPNRTGVPLGVYISPKLMEAFASFVEDSKPRTSKTAIVEMLLEQFLKDKGRWPPDEEPKERGD